MANFGRGGNVGWKQLRVGLTILVGLIVLAVGIYKVGQVLDVFADRYTVYTLAQNVNGLTKGSPVLLAGQRIGQISDIRFLPPGRRLGGYNLIIDLDISEKVKPQVRRNSIAFIRSIGLLGDKIIDIQPGTVNMAVLGAGDTLESSTAGDFDYIIAQGAQALDSLLLLSADLRRITRGVAAGEGTIGRLLMDPVLYGQMVTATGELRGMLVSVNRSDGTLNRLIHDPALYHQFSSAVARVDTLTLAIVNGRGSLGKLLHNDTLYMNATAVLASADSAVMNLNALSKTMVEGKGSIQKLFTDPALYDQFLKTVVDLQTLIAALRADPKLISPQITVDVF
jgi:phospholipid/cholesterol/gamma-HCH transport system substrate-binding protein